MTKATNRNNQNALLLVNAEPKEVMQLRQDMPDWLWIEAPKRWPFANETEPVARAFQAIIVFTQQGTEAWALAVCKQICEKQLLEEVPLLVAGSRYQIPLSHVVERLSRGSFIFTPVEEKTLLGRIQELKAEKL